MTKIVEQPLDNVYISGEGFITKKELRSVLSNAVIRQAHPDSNAFLEVFAVTEVTPSSKIVRGRYCYSKHGQTASQTPQFLPANSNIIQYPLVGELWLGFSYKDENYYLSRLSDSNISINYQKLGESTKGYKDRKEAGETKEEVLSRDYGMYINGGKFVNIEPMNAPITLGDTIVQGRFGNSIQLGSNQPAEEKSPNMTLQLQDKSEESEDTFIKLTTKEVVTYPEQVEMDSEYDNPQILLSSDRLVLNAEKDMVGMFAKKDITTKSDDGNIFINAQDDIELSANKLINNILNGEMILNKTKDGIPFGQLDMIGFLKQTMGIQKLFQALTVGVPKLSNPVTLPSGVKDIVKGLKGAEDFITATLELEFISKSLMETKTIEEIKAVLPIPDGFAGIIDDVSNITDEQITALEELEASNKVILDKSKELETVINMGDKDAVKEYLENLEEVDFTNMPGTQDILDASKKGKKSFENFIDEGGLTPFQISTSNLEMNQNNSKQAKSYQKLFKNT